MLSSAARNLFRVSTRRLPIAATTTNSLSFSVFNNNSFRSFSQHAPEDASLWDRMGGEDVIRPLVEDIYGLHISDPLTKSYFGGNKFNNDGAHEYVKNRIFTFFSAGIGGPYEYEGAFICRLVTLRNGVVRSRLC